MVRTRGTEERFLNQLGGFSYYRRIPAAGLTLLEGLGANFVIGTARGDEASAGNHQWSKEPTMKSLFSRFAKDESGATAIEYGLIAAIVGVGIVVALTTLRNGLSGTFSTVATNMTSAR
jgi:pilus assembly protein Flp/PilA